MSVRIANERGDRLLIRVGCDGCHRTAASDHLTPTELCRLISWEHDGTSTVCVQCQWLRGETPGFVDRYDDREPAEPRSWLQRVSGGDWWRSDSGPRA